MGVIRRQSDGYKGQSISVTYNTIEVTELFFIEEEKATLFKIIKHGLFALIRQVFLLLLPHLACNCLSSKADDVNLSSVTMLLYPFPKTERM